jgi:catechol 2,3-dioxygenase-like lactoylglutathione lyase family enzyme
VCHSIPVTSNPEPALVPELLVRDLPASLGFWSGLCGFEVRYDRPEEGFAYIALGAAHLMLERLGAGRQWIAAPIERPFGRGVNFQVSVPDVEPILAALRAADVALFMPPEEKWYRVGDEEAGVRQFLVADPDGYLIRFQASIGRRTAAV